MKVSLHIVQCIYTDVHRAQHGKPNGKELCFYSPVFRPVHSIADELQFKQRQHIAQMPASGGSASLFSGHHQLLFV